MVKAVHFNLVAIGKLLLIGLVALVNIVVFLLFTPQYTHLNSQRLAPEAISVLPHEGAGPFRRKRAGETEYNLNSAREIPAQIRRQYTYRFDLAEMPISVGEVYVPAIGGTAMVYVNGVQIGTAQETISFIPGFSRRYIYASIPIQTYQTGINRLTIVLKPDNSYTGITTIYMGKSGDFERDADHSKTSAQNFLIVFGIGGFTLLLISLLGLLMRARPVLYGPVFGMGTGLIGLTLLSNSNLIPSLATQNLWASGLYALIAVSALAGAWLRRVAFTWFYWGLWLAAILAISLGLINLLPIAWPSYVSDFAYFCAGGFLPFGITYALGCLSGDWQTAKLSQAEMREKIAEQQSLIAAQEKAIEDGLKAKGRLEERQRLTRDIHDGIGGHLLSLLVRVRDGDMSQADIESDLQYGLNDLRLIVDSMDHSDDSLDAAFVTFRARAKAQLGAAGIALKWSESESFVPTHFGPAAILNIYRLMQEAVTNAIRHARCDQLTIRVSRKNETDSLVISLTDNGKGFDASKSFKAGQGIKNMRYRAKMLGGTFSISPGETCGTEVKITVQPNQAPPQKGPIT